MKRSIKNKTAARSWMTLERRRSVWGYIFLSPWLLGLVLVFIVPMILSLTFAFSKVTVDNGYSLAFIGLDNFYEFLTGVYAWRVIRNTLLINIYQILFSFTASIVFALMINQMMDGPYKSLIQTATYMPHFISIVVVCGLLAEFCESDGLINDIRAFLGLERTSLLAQPKYFRTIFVGSDIWQHVGWGTIIYLATLSGVDQSLHEAAAIDGAGRMRRILHVNLPAIMPVIVIQLIMRVGRMMLVGFDKVILLYSPATYETADVISSYVYRRGLYNMDYSYGAAVGLFNSVINLMILIGANAFSRRITGNSLW